MKEHAFCVEAVISIERKQWITLYSNSHSAFYIQCVIRNTSKSSNRYGSELSFCAKKLMNRIKYFSNKCVNWIRVHLKKFSPAGTDIFNAMFYSIAVALTAALAALPVNIHRYTLENLASAHIVPFYVTVKHPYDLHPKKLNLKLNPSLNFWWTLFSSSRNLKTWKSQNYSFPLFKTLSETLKLIIKVITLMYCNVSCDFKLSFTQEFRIFFFSLVHRHTSRSLEHGTYSILKIHSQNKEYILNISKIC